MMRSSATDQADASNHVRRGDELRRSGDLEAALEEYLRGADTEVPSSTASLRLAQVHEQIGNRADAARWALAVGKSGDEFAAWQAAAGILERCISDAPPPIRTVRLAVLGSSTTTQLTQLMRLAARLIRIDLELYEALYGQVRQEIIDEHSDLYRFAPDFILIATQTGDLHLPRHSLSPEEDVTAELERWTSLWTLAAEHSLAGIVQTTFALPPEDAFGHLAGKLAGSRYRMIQSLNARLGDHAAACTHPVFLLDCDRLSALIGKERWFDPRFWHLSKNAVAPDCLPFLARHLAAVLGAALGINKKCIILDLDNTLWGGVIGEDGIEGIRLGNGPDGEAYVAFQEYLLDLKHRGVILAVCSKNNEADAMGPFRRHPDMRLRLDDIAAFVADWRSKPEQIRSATEILSIDPSAVVFVDDNPAEREAIRQLLPDVDVLTLPPDPSYYARALASYLPIQTAAYTAEDAERTLKYQARAQAAKLQTSATSLEDFYASLQMEAVIQPFDDVSLPRVAQLVAKTNQFNLTTRRHGEGLLRQFAREPDCVHLTVRLRDRFADHGLVGVLIALPDDGDTLEIDTFLMSCRVIGRTLEAAIVNHLCVEAEGRGMRRLRGTFIPTAKNGPAANVYERLGFELVQRSPDGTTTWAYDLQELGPIPNPFIDVEAWTHVS
jgi:FkbH-like protein